MLDELRSLYDDSGMWGQLIVAAELGLVIVGIVMLYVVKQAARFFMYILIAFLPVLLGLSGYFQFSGELSDMIEKGLESDIVEQFEENVYNPLILGGIAVVIPLFLGFIGLRKVRKAKGPPDYRLEERRPGP